MSRDQDLDFLIKAVGLPGRRNAIFAPPRDEAEWFAEALAIADATTERLAAEMGELPVDAARKAADLATELALLLSTPVKSGDLLHTALHTSLRSSRLAERLETAFRVTFPDTTDALVAFAREWAALEKLSRKMSALHTFVHLAAELFSEAFRDFSHLDDSEWQSIKAAGTPLHSAGEPAAASHGKGVKGSPFTRFIQALAKIHARRFKERTGTESPLRPAAITPKVIRLALMKRDPGYRWTGDSTNPAWAVK
jgi:hypothetical protein